jgi:hypothetical protein
LLKKNGLEEISFNEEEEDETAIDELKKNFHGTVKCFDTITNFAEVQSCREKNRESRDVWNKNCRRFSVLLLNQSIELHRRRILIYNQQSRV